jgi:hypothetical protein
MIGLLIKDFLVLKKYICTLFILVAIYVVFSFTSGNMSFLNGMVSVVFAMIVITTFSYDDLAKWDKYALSMPITRKEMVLSKYLIAFIFMITGSVVSILSTVIFTLIKGSDFDIVLFLPIIIISEGAVLFNSILIPLIYKFGVEKSRIMIFIVLAIPTVIVIILGKMNITMPSEETLIKFFYFSPLVVILFLCLSIFISTEIYKNKEL